MQNDFTTNRDQKILAHCNQTHKNATMIKWIAFSMLGMILALLSTHPYAEENLYAQNYKAQNTTLSSLQANPDTKMYVSNHKDEDNIKMLEDGYDLIGSSGFEGGDVAPDLALQHAKAIKADVVLVYSKYGSTKTSHSKIELIKEAAKTGKALTEQDVAEEPTNYEYYASYWVKTPMPSLGIHVIKLIPKARPTDSEPMPEIKGLKIIAVIKNSPAAQAGLMRGDIITSINDINIDKPEELSGAVKKYRGQPVSIHFVRDDEAHTGQTTLN
jgi:hypothetical protein